MKDMLGKQPEKQLCIGLPRAMLYYRYEVLWKSYISALGMRGVVSKPTTKDTIQAGAEVAIDEACFSMKIYMGHIRSLIGKCDYILIPRINNVGLHRDMCTRFWSAYDVVCNVFRGSGQKFICYNVDVQKKLTEEKAFISMGIELGFSKKASADAYKKAKKNAQENYKKSVRAQEIMMKKDGMKILIAGHSYVLSDPYIGKPVTDYLIRMGTLPLRADLVDRKEAHKQAIKASPTLKWELSREIVGSIQMNKDRIDGIVLLSAFSCGPDSMVNEMIIRKFRGIPILNLVLDDQSGTAGLETRLESFVDILKFRKGVL